MYRRALGAPGIGRDESMVTLDRRASRSLLAVAGLAFAAAGAMLSGCSETTYGTGVNPGAQTLKDMVGIAAISGPKQAPINYGPRPKIVAPPDGAAPLPAPETVATAADGASTDDPSLPPNWPKDPDLAAAKFKADVAAREARGEPAPKLNLPPGSLPQFDAQSQPDYHDPAGSNYHDPSKRTYSKEEIAQIRKAFSDAKGGLAVDANGNPVRRYLTDPPVELRAPDTTQPVAFTEKKKKFHWFWQKQDDDPDTMQPVAGSDAGAAPNTAATSISN
jgi:hypothetical protein